LVKTVLQLAAGDAGFELANTLPASSTATQSELFGHETPVSAAVPSASEDHPPPTGCVAVKATPRSSTATHNPADGQDTAVRTCPESIAAGKVHGAPGDAGSVALSTPPERSTATQKDSLTHETALSGALSIVAGADQPSAGVAAAWAGNSSATASASIRAGRIGARARTRQRRDDAPIALRKALR
jgi:hypothetical protein